MKNRRCPLRSALVIAVAFALATTASTSKGSMASADLGGVTALQAVLDRGDTDLADFLVSRGAK